MAGGKRIKWTFEMCAKYVSEETDCTLLSTEYVPASKGKMVFTCCTCGKPVEWTWSNFYNRGVRSCKKCANHRRVKTTGQFINEIYASYGSSITVLGVYQGTMNPIRCRCNVCGQDKWLIRPDKLLGGGKCPNCNNKTYRGEAALRDLVQSLQVPFKEQFTFPDCIGSKGGVCRFDCAVLDSSDQSPLLLIEFDGVQHFKPVEFFGGQQAFEYRQRNDRIKDSYCRDHGIPLLRISYKQFDQIEQLVTDKLYELNILQKEAA